MHRLFCYGTLQVPQVIRAVTGRAYFGTAAALRDYAIYRVKNAEYPGITYSAGRVTQGVLYEDISNANLKRLDLFEGEFYDRQMLDVRLPDQKIKNAWVYVIAKQHTGVLSEDCWRLTDFLDNGLDKFMKRYVQARRNIYAV